MLQIPSEVKELLHQEDVRKNIRIHFPFGERGDVCNSMIVKDSVKFTESMCSQDQLKFGLCEASTFECETVGVENIKGCNIDVYCEIFCDSTVEDAVFMPDLMAYVYQIPFGRFKVADCKRQIDVNNRKVTAYGGTALEESQNPILAAKKRVLYSSKTDYSPDIFKSYMMFSGASYPLPEATMEDVTFEDYVDIEAGSIQDGDYNYAMHVRNVRTGYYKQEGYVNDEDDLFYCEFGPSTKTIAEIKDELNGDTDPLWAFLPANIFGCGADVNTVAESADYQMGSYVYPYQCHNEESGGFLNILIPYKIFFTRHRNVYPYGEVEIYAESTFRDPSTLKIYNVDVSNYPQDRFTVKRDIKKGSFWVFDDSAIDYRAWFNSSLELYGLFARLDRFNTMRLYTAQPKFNLFPDSDLYPSEDLYPSGSDGERMVPSDTQQCWYDDEYKKPYGAIQCKYKDSGGDENIYTYYLDGYDEATNPDSYLIYDLSDNMIIQAAGYSSSSPIYDICEEMKGNIEGITYMPVDYTGRGLPYVEAGDTIEILTKNSDSITTIVMNRTITGEQVLTDSIKSV